jgi:hypothetical protein
MISRSARVPTRFVGFRAESLIMASADAAVDLARRKIADSVRSLLVGRLWVHWIGDHRGVPPS